LLQAALTFTPALFSLLESLLERGFRLLCFIGALTLCLEGLPRTLFLFERELLSLPSPFCFERFSFEGRLDAEEIPAGACDDDRQHPANRQALEAKLPLLDRFNGSHLPIVGKQTLPLGSSGLRLCFELHTELRFLFGAAGSLFLFAAGVLLFEASLFIGASSGFLCLGTLTRGFFFAFTRLLGCFQTRFFLFPHSGFLKTVELPQLRRQGVVPRRFLHACFPPPH